MDDTMTVTEAEDKAKALRADGRLVYQISLERWVELFGDHGLTIFKDLQESNDGHVRCVFYYNSLVFLECEL